MSVLKYVLSGMVAMILVVIFVPNFQTFAQKDASVVSSEPRSPVFLGEWEGRGSGHAFGYDVIYKVDSHVVDKELGLMAVVTSPSEKGVSIWTPIPEIMKLRAGDMFKINSGIGDFAENLEVLK